jgi:hypothetical protein
MSFMLTHPDSSASIEVEASQVPLYLAQGWETKPGAATPENPDEGPQTTVLADAAPAEASPEGKK